MITCFRWNVILISTIVAATAGSVPWWPAYIGAGRACRRAIKPQTDPIYGTWVKRARALPDGKARTRVVRVLRKASAAADNVGADDAPNSEIHCLIVALWAETGDFPGAIAAARIIPRDYNRALALIEIALAQVDAGDSPGAKQTLDQLALASRGGARDPCYRTVSALNRSRASGAIPPIDGVCDVADHISRAYARAGDVRTALSLLRLIDESEFAVRGIAEAQALTGHVAGALQTVRVLPVAHRDWCLHELASNVAELGRLREAFRIAASIRDVQLRASALRSISIVRNGEEIAHPIMVSIQPIYSRVIPDSLLRAARMLGLAADEEAIGATRGAVELLARASGIAADGQTPLSSSYFVESPAFPFRSKAQLLGTIAEVQSRLGDADGALATVGVIRADWHSSARGWGRPKKDPGAMQSGLVLMAMAEAQIRAGSSRTAPAWIERVDSPMEKAYALAGVARALIDRARSTSSE